MLARQRTAVLAWSLLLVSAGPGLADQASMQQRLPAQTQLYAYWAGRSLTFDGSMLGQMIQQGRLRHLTDSIRDAVLADAQPSNRARIQHLWNMLAIGWQHPSAVSVSGIGPNSEPSLILLVDLGKERADFARQLDALLTELTKQAGNPLRKTQLGNHNFTVLQDTPPIYVGLAGNLLVLAVGDGLNRIDLDGKAGGALAGNPRFLKAMKQVAGKDVQFACYADFEGLVTGLSGPPAATGQPQPGSPRAVLDDLGLANVQSLAGTVRTVDKGMLTTFRLNVPAPHGGLLAPLAGPTPLTAKDLAELPADTDFLLAIKNDPDQLFDELLGVLRNLAPPLADELETEFFADFREHLGFDLRKDLLASLGPTFRLSTAPSRGGPLVSAMLTADVRDDKTLRAAMDNFRKGLTREFGSEVRFQTLKQGDAVIHYLRIRTEPMPVLPAWCVQGKKLHVALWPQVIASALAETSPSLVESAGYKLLRNRLPKNAHTLLYADTPALVRLAYPGSLIFGTLATDYGKPNDRNPPLWPGSVQEAIRFLQPSMTVLASDPEGITLSGFGSLPALATDVPFVLAETLGALLPGLHRARQQAQKTVSTARLRSLLVGCILHSTEHDGTLPTSLKQLIEAGFISPDMLVSPMSGRPAPQWDDEKKQLIGEVDYILMDYSGIKLEQIPSPSETLLAYERPENFRPDEDIPVGFVDGHVEHVSRDQLKKLLVEAKALEKKSNPKPPPEKQDF